MESKRSCVSRTKCCGIPAVKGCFIFSIINAVIISICLAACICYIGWTIFKTVTHDGHDTSSDGLELYLTQMLCIILSVCTVISFIFAVLLCYGAHKKRRAFLMAYFVYGVLVEVLSVVGAIAFLVMTYDHDDPNVEQTAYGSAALIGCVIYAFPLVLVYRAYLALSSDSVLHSGHAKLINHYPVL